MLQIAIHRSRALASLFLLVTTFSLAFAQESSVINVGGSLVGMRILALPGSGPIGDPATILARFVEVETKAREALNQHTFKRDVVLQTIGRNGEVTGEYVRNSQFLFDDKGRRIERVLFHPPSGIREMRITKEDIQDLAGNQLLGIDIVEATKYRLTYAGQQIVDSRRLLAIDVTPLTQPDPKRMSERFFVGRVWIDPVSYQIVKIRGVVEPQGKQRFPIFVTWREPLNGAFAFPARTEADDILRFPKGNIHYRIKVSYHDYKLFGSKVTITEIDEAPSASLAPTTPPKPQAKQEACITNRNAPPVSSYRWPADAQVKVYIIRSMFTSEQQEALLQALKTWTTAGQQTGSGVTFAYAGETENLVNCKSCLTLRKREVFKYDGKHYSFFNPLSSEEGRVLLSAWIDLDFATTNPQALQGFIAHELGHGMGLWDCHTCKKKRTIMSGFPGINKDNGLIGPSRCDLETLKDVYVQERLIAAARRSEQKSLQQSEAPIFSTMMPSGFAFESSSSLLDLPHVRNVSPLFWSNFLTKR